MKCRLTEEQGWKDAELVGLVWADDKRSNDFASLADLEAIVKVEGDGPFVRKLHFSAVEMCVVDWRIFLRQVC